MWVELSIWLVVGLLFGLLLQWVFWPSRYTLLVNLLVGVGGALVLGLIGNQAFGHWLTVLVLSALGAVAGLICLRLFDKSVTPSAQAAVDQQSASVSAIGPSVDVAVRSQNAELDAAQPTVNLPEVDADISRVGAAIDTTLPEVDMPEVDMPESDTTISGLRSGIDATLPTVALPIVDAAVSGPRADINTALPIVDMPEVDMPESDTTISGLRSGIDATLPAVALPIADVAVSGPRANFSTALPEVDLLEASNTPVEVSDLTATGAASLGIGLGSAIGSDDAPNIGNTNYPDDLTEIHGIGKVYERKLYEAGIFTYAQVANTDIALLSQYANAIDAANVEEWPNQARSLAAKYNRENAIYQGELPDKLAILPLISEATEQRLYRAGIFTYRQLAAAEPEQLRALLPTQRANQVDVNSWIAAAAQKLAE